MQLHSDGLMGICRKDEKCICIVIGVWGKNDYAKSNINMLHDAIRKLLERVKLCDLYIVSCWKLILPSLLLLKPHIVTLLLYQWILFYFLMS